MRQNERSNEEELELFADLLDPAAELLADPEIAAVLRGSGTVGDAVKRALRVHKAAVLEILARLEDTPPAAYRVRASELPGKLMALFSLPGVRDLFPSQGRRDSAGSSGSASESIGAPPK